MPIENQKYAFVTNEGWERSLSERWPDAPLYGGYRLLVFAGADLPKIENEYADADFKYLSTSETIKAIESAEVGPFICDINQAREIAKHFTPVNEDEI